MAYDKKAGSRIQQFRKKHTKYTQADMAEMLHMTTENYALYERDRTQFQIEMMCNISDILGMPIPLMFYDDDEENVMKLTDDEIHMLSVFRESTDEKKKAIICLLT